MFLNKIGFRDTEFAVFGEFIFENYDRRKVIKMLY